MEYSKSCVEEKYVCYGPGSMISMSPCSSLVVYNEIKASHRINPSSIANCCHQVSEGLSKLRPLCDAVTSPTSLASFVYELGSPMHVRKPQKDSP